MQIHISCLVEWIQHNNGPWWRHQMETFSALLALCAGNSPVTGEFPSQRPVMWSFNMFFDLRLKNGRVNNRNAGDLRRHCAHYDVTVMQSHQRRCVLGQQTWSHRLCTGVTFQTETPVYRQTIIQILATLELNVTFSKLLKNTAPQ